jgi:hypothetical protein
MQHRRLRRRPSISLEHQLHARQLGRCGRGLIEAGAAIAADREEWEVMREWYCKQCGCDWSRHSRRFKKPGGVNATRA